MTTGMVLTPNVRERINKILKHIEGMEFERQGFGDGAMRDVEYTRKSFVRALGTLLGAEELWPDGFEEDSLSLGGVMPGGIVFGMIGRYRVGWNPDWREPFEFQPVDWSFHS